MTATLIFFFMLAISYINSHFLLKRLKIKHADIWLSMGMPKLSDSNLCQQTKALSTFLWRGKFLHLGDPQLSFMCITSMALWLGAFIAFMFVLFV
jgi:hypothetical protein